MSGKLVPYEKYKDSGVEWLGMIPAEWGVLRLKWSVDIQKNGVWGDEPTGDNNDIICIRVADFDRSQQSVKVDNLTVRNVVLSDRVDRTLSKGDLLLEKSGGGDLWPVGYVVKFDHDFPAVCSNFVARVKVAVGWDSNYLKYVHLGFYQRKITTRTINQTSGIQNLDASAYFNTATVFPPLSKQLVIATYLDTQTQRIDALIKEQQELIELLREKRQALISHAVTKGIDHSAKMKDSGVSWLGKIPEEWSVTSLKHQWEVIDCKHLTAEFTTDESGIPLASIQEVQSWFVNLDSAERTTEEFYLKLIEGGREPKSGDLIFSRNATVGEVAQVPTVHPRFSMGQDVTLLRKKTPATSTDYYQFVLKSHVVKQQLDLQMIGSTFKRINVEEIRNFVVPLPPVSQQNEVADFISTELQKMDSVISEAESTITLMQEHRSALISAVVTGKVRVPA